MNVGSVKTTVSKASRFGGVETSWYAKAAVQSAGQARQTLQSQRAEVSTRAAAASLRVFAHLHQQISAGCFAEDGAFSIQYSTVSSRSYIRNR